MQTPGSQSSPWYLPALSCLFVFLPVIIFTVPDAGAQANNQYVERQVSFANGQRKLSGSLYLPASLKGKVPVVLFVAGERPGELDRDALQKLARGIAAAGIATLYYQESSFEPNENRLDLITEDATAALQLLGTLPEIDSSAEIVFGHSLGGTIAPYVAERYPRVRGVILAAAAVTPIDRSILSQHRISLASRGRAEKEIEEAVNSEAKILDDVRSGKIPAPRMINGAPASFWRDWMNRDPIRELAKSKVAALVLQGEQDTANEIDSERLQKQIEDLGPRAQLRVIPGVDAYFLSGQKQSPESDQLVEIVSRWVLKTASGK